MAHGAPGARSLHSAFGVAAAPAALRCRRRFVQRWPKGLLVFDVACDWNDRCLSCGRGTRNPPSRLRETSGRAGSRFFVGRVATDGRKSDLIPQSIKDAYYGILFPLSKALRPIYRLHHTRRNGRVRRVQLGCGPKYLDGFINIDGNFQRRVDYLMDIRAGLPFDDDSIEFIYSCHTLEHLFITDALTVLGECRRVLRPYGVL